MTRIANLEKQAAALKAANMAKYKAEGFSHRLELRVHGGRGGVEVVVLYMKTEPSTDVIARNLMKRKSTVLDDYLVEAL